MSWMTGGGQHIPAGLSYPRPKTLEQWLCTDNEITFKCYIRENDENFLISNISCLFTTTSHYKCLGWWVGGNLSQLVYLTPHPRLWSSDCVQIMKITFKCYISENDENFLISNISCLFTTTSHYKCLGWRVGGNLSQLVYLTPHPRLWSSDCVQIMKMTFKCYISENYEITLKVGSFSFECIINMLIYFISCLKALFTRKWVSFSKKCGVKSIRLAMMQGIP